MTGGAHVAVLPRGGAGDEERRIARLAVVDAHDGLVGYELRGDGERGGLRLPLDVLERGIDALCPRTRAIVPIPSELLRGEAVEALPRQRVTLAVTPDEGDPSLLARVQALVACGRRIAVEATPSTPPAWLDVADVISVDASALGLEELEEMADVLRGHGVPLWARRLAQAERVHRCRELGFHRFEGPALARPELVSVQGAPSARPEILTLLETLARSEVELGELEDAIARDVTLAYRLLRFLNSARFSLPRRVSSVHHAVVLLGRDRLRRWAQLMALSELGQPRPALLGTALTRARMCEALGEELGRYSTDTYFAAGLFSVLDGLLGRPMSELLGGLSLSLELQAALLHRRGPLGRTLASVEDYVDGEWKGLDCRGLPPDSFSDAYFDAVRWADSVLLSD